MPKSKKVKAEKPKEFFIEGLQEITDPNAPVVSNEFIDKVDGNEYVGQTIEVKSDTKLESDLGEGAAVILRTFEFGASPLIFKNGMPHPQDIFNSHLNGIMSILWADGLQPAEEIEPRIIFSKDRTKYLIMIGAKTQRGQLSLEKNLLEQSQTLSQIVHEGRKHRDSV